MSLLYYINKYVSMAVIKSLTKVPELLASNPVLFVPLFILYLLNSIQTVSQSVAPLAGAVVALVMSAVLFFLGPLFQAGTIGMANEAATSRRTSLGSFVRDGKQYYLSVLGAYLGLLAIMIALFIAGGIAVGIVAAIYAFVSDSLLVVALGALVGLAAVGSYLAVGFSLQFYAHAIVIEEYGAVDGFKRSMAVVRQNLRPVIGYFAVLMAGGLTILVVYSGLLWISPVDFFAEPGTVSLSTALIEALLMVVVLAPVGAVYLVYSVLFYRTLLGETPVTTAPEQSTDAAVESSA